MEPVPVPVLVIGAGQSGLAVGYHLRRLGLAPGSDVVLLDAGSEPGGAWPETWDSLRLFSPAQFSSLPGRPMPPWRDGYPPAEHVRAYLADYEQRYDLAVRRPVAVRAVTRVDDGRRLLVQTDDEALAAQVVVSATGTWRRPFWPAVPGTADFEGRQLHSSAYRRPEDLRGQRVLVVGGGNTAAQLLAELSEVAETTWVTLRPPRFMPDDVDGRVLFDVASRRAAALAAGETVGGVGGLGDVVMVPPVKAARDRGVLHAEPMVSRLTRDGVRWADGREQPVDTIVWCTGFRPVLGHLSPLGLRTRDGIVETEPDRALGHGTRSVVEPRLHLVGYGDWTGFASATLIGVGRTARTAAASIVEQLRTDAG